MTPERSRLRMSKTEAVGRRGMAATKHPESSRVAVDVLQAGGNAADAAVAAALAVGVVEPWSSGIGGGGYALVARDGEVEAIHFPMQSGARATPDRYPLDGRRGVNAFLWDGVVNDANLHGWDAMSVPGAVAGLAMLAERHGTMPWAALVEPAVALAREGYDLTWFDSLVLGRDVPAAWRHPSLARVFYVDGGPRRPDPSHSAHFRQPELADTLETLAHDGPSAFYRGDIAAAIADDCVAHGGVLERDDLAAYAAWSGPAAALTYHDHTVYAPGPGCAGMTTLQTLAIYAHAGPPHDYDDVDRLQAFLWAARLAQADRLAYMADPNGAAAPWDALLQPAYAADRAAAIDLQRAADDPGAGDAWAHSATGHDLERHKNETSTTHLCVADEKGLAVSLTNTVGGAWGSEVIPGRTGVVWNDGMWWFDPQPGRPNSVAPRSFGLNNMTPALVLKGGRPRLAVGASGGRRITNCVAQLICHVVDHEMGVQEALDAPRVDASTPSITVDARWGTDTLADLRRRGWDVVVPPWPEQSAFASPVAILWHDDGSLRGGADTFHSAEARGW